MAASTAGALKAYIESLGLSLPAFRDKKPTGQDLDRWVEITEDVSTVPDGAFNAFDDPDGHVSEVAGVDPLVPTDSIQVGVELRCRQRLALCAPLLVLGIAHATTGVARRASDERSDHHRQPSPHEGTAR